MSEKARDLTLFQGFARTIAIRKMQGVQNSALKSRLQHSWWRPDTPPQMSWAWPRALLCRVATHLLALLLCVGTAVSVDQVRLQQAARALGPAAVEGLTAWQGMFRSASQSPEKIRIETVNRFINQRIRFADDVNVWGEADYWATPLETLHKGAGDCEDFAIAKYFSLLALGVAPSRLRLIYVRATVIRDGVPGYAAHMVLAYYPQQGREPLVLDNLVDSIHPASGRPDLRPIFSFNTGGLWEQIGTTAASVPLDRLSRWRDLLQRVSNEGFR